MTKPDDAPIERIMDLRRAIGDAVRTRGAGLAEPDLCLALIVAMADIIRQEPPLRRQRIYDGIPAILADAVARLDIIHAKAEAAERAAAGRPLS